MFRHSIHPSNENTNTTDPHSSTHATLTPNEPAITITNNPLTTNPTLAVTAAPLSHSSSTHSIFTTSNDDENPSRRSTATDQLITNLVTPNRSASSLFFAKLTDAKKSLFGRSTTPDAYFSSAVENRALLSYILDEPQPRLEIIQELENNGAQLNAITEDGNTSIHLLARTENRSPECAQIVNYFIQKGCDPNRQNDYGWTAGAQRISLHLFILSLSLSLSF